ncbi:glycosyltransferase [Gemmobacter denitrificans]|uniref:Glycosyltransferase n=1 Tax=Gemmobacter denitrificans TaxID=3123040 RepID=A0ABU8BRP7_9RHOB
MTRWEATGWAVFLRYRGPLPGQPVARIMQFWDRAEPPADVARAMAGWVHLGPVVRRFDAAHAGRFIARVAGADAARDFAALWHPALQSDLFRLYWLLETGGAYIDADGLAQPGAAALLAQAAGGGMVAAAMTRLPRAVAINGVLVAPKVDPLIADWLAEALRRIHDRPGGPIFWLTGPGCLTELLWARGSTSTGPVPLPLAALDQAFRQLDAGYKQTDANWRVAEHRAGLSDAADIRRLFPQKT